MSVRNVGLFLSGHVPPQAVASALLAIPGVSADELQGEEAPRVGHGTWKGRPYTHVGLRLFEVGGLLLFDGAPIPGPDEVEMRLASTLSKNAGQAVYLRYDDESAVGGHARFEGGRLVSRVAIDGRESRPVLRDLEGERVIPESDAADWVWTPMAEAVEAGAKPLFGEGVRSDEDIESLIHGADAKPIAVHAAAAGPRPAPQPEPRPASRPEPAGGAQEGGLLGRLARKVAGKIRS